MKTLCNKCGRHITNNNFHRHHTTCDGTYFTGSHKPKIDYKTKALKVSQELEKFKSSRDWDLIQDRYNNFPIGLVLKEFNMKQYEFDKAIRLGCLIKRSKDHLTEIRRTAARKANNGGYRPGAGNSKRFKVKTPDGEEVTLQSSYELMFSKILNEEKISWNRPPPLEYEINNKIKKYYPDFLIENKIYVDTKNPYLMIKDQEKINRVEKYNKVKIFLIGKENINKDFILSLLG